MGNYEINFPVHEKRSIKLELPNIVKNVKGEEIGVWTMVFDEGFEIKINNQSFFAFSYYKI
jgi:hypothetical protein